MKGLLLTLLWAAPFLLFGQDGSSGDPYTELGHAYSVPSSGIYYFNISGTSFSTYVEADNGWILAASGSSSTTESSYPNTTNLTLQSDKRLPNAIYTSNLIIGVRMNATSGPDIPFDVQSTASGVLTNLKNNKTLSYNTNYTDWTGTGTARLQRGCPGNYASLGTHIYHACGIGTNMHWQVGQFDVHERVNLGSGLKNDLNLWIRAAPVSLPLLPIELEYFTATLVDKKVELNWKTTSQINNDYFSVERSRNGASWEIMAKINGAGSSVSQLTYSFTDKKPYTGISYYRIKQTDFDGHFTYSTIKSININHIENAGVRIFPNPASHELMIQGHPDEIEGFKLYTLLGVEVSNMLKILSNNESHFMLDISSLPTGTYLLKTKTFSNRIFKQ